MINLIPPDARARVKREYWVRVVSVWMLLIGVAFAMLTLLYVPLYVLVYGQLNAFSDSYEAASQDDVQFKESEALITQANLLGNLLTTNVSTRSFSALEEKVAGLAGEGVVIETMSLTRAAAAPASIVVNGTAATRLDLATFKDDLAADPEFATVELPLSNLAKDKEIPFSISITLTAPKPS